MKAGSSRRGSCQNIHNMLFLDCLIIKQYNGEKIKRRTATTTSIFGRSCCNSSSSSSSSSGRGEQTKMIRIITLLFIDQLLYYTIIIEDIAAQIAAIVVVEVTFDCPSFFWKKTRKVNSQKTRKVNNFVVAAVEVVTIGYPSFLTKKNGKRQ